MSARLLLAGLLLAGWMPALAQQPAPLTPQALDAALAAAPHGADAERLADRVREWFGGSERLLSGSATPKIEGLQVAWAIELPSAASTDAEIPIVESDAVHFTRRLTRIGTTNLYATVTSLSQGDAFTWHFDAGHDGASAAASSRSTRRIPTAVEHPGVPRGVVTQSRRGRARSSRAPRATGGSTSPRSTRPRTPPAVMVFQDGAGPKDCVPTVFDNLIAKGDMPVTVGIFIEPGRRSTTAARTAASSTTRSRTSTRGSCSRRSCPRSRRP